MLRARSSLQHRRCDIRMARLRTGNLASNSSDRQQKYWCRFRLSCRRTLYAGTLLRMSSCGRDDTAPEWWEISLVVDIVTQTQIDVNSPGLRASRHRSIDVKP